MSMVIHLERSMCFRKQSVVGIRFAFPFSYTCSGEPWFAHRRLRLQQEEIYAQFLKTESQGYSYLAQ